MAVEIKLFDKLDEVAADAGGALDREAQPLIYDRIDWFRKVCAYTPEGRPLVVRARNGLSRCWLFLSVQGRSAEALTNWYGLRYGPVVHGEPGATPPLGELARGLRQAGISHVFLEPMDEDDPLPAALQRKGWMIRRSPINASWKIDTRGMSFEKYWAARPSRIRKATERRLRQGKVECVIHDRFDEQAWRDYESVYAASWKPAEGAPDFVRLMAEQEGAAGTLRLGVAYHEGQAVAAQLWVIEHGVATIHKLAYREDARQLSPGTILSYELFRRALDVEKVDMIDFGIGDHTYKSDWMSYCVPLYALTAYDMLRPAGIAGIAKSLASKLVARLRRS